MTLRRFAFVWLLCCAGSMAAQDTFYFAGVLSPVSPMPDPRLQAMARLTLNGDKLIYEAWAYYARPWVAVVRRQRTDEILFFLQHSGCAAPLAPFQGSCTWYGETMLTAQHVQELTNESWLIEVSVGGDASSLMRGKIFLDNNLNDIPDREEDTDADGVCNADDLCPETLAGARVDSRGCTIDDIERFCPCENGWKNHGRYVSCVSENVERFVAEGVVTVKEGAALVREAAKSDCGKK